MVWQIILGCLGSAGFFQLIQFFVNRHDAKKGVLAALKAEIAELREALKKQEKVNHRTERDNCRTQMLLLMSDFPTERGEIMLLAKRYFVDLEGDWYATSLFQSWMKKNDIIPPPWFNPNHHDYVPGA